MRRLREVTGLGILILALLAAPALAGDPATLRLAQEADASGTSRITATVTDASGATMKGTAVTFRVRTAFGWLEVAEIKTDGNGRAAITLPASPRYPEVAAEAVEGTDVRAGLVLAQADRRAPAVRPGRDILSGLSPQPGFLSPYPPIQILFVAVLLGGIWTTYAYLVSLLIRIRRAP